MLLRSMKLDFVRTSFLYGFYEENITIIVVPTHESKVLTPSLLKRLFSAESLNDVLLFNHRFRRI